jgi:hypothetical protein
LWERDRIVRILKNPTYTGVRYLNQLAVVHEVPGAARTTKRKRFVLRNRDEWIGIKVPAIVSQELFDKVQERLRVVKSRYCKLSQTALLTGYVRCADCGRNFGHGYMQSRYRLRTGGTATHERGQYRCSKRQSDSFHHVSNRGRCRNTSIATTLLDHTVVNLIRDTMLDPEKLSTCIEGGTGNTPPPDLRRIASDMNGLNEKRRRNYDACGKGQITAEHYIGTSRAIDDGIVDLRREKETILSAWRQTNLAESLTARVRQFCAAARARFDECIDLDAKRAFLRDYVEGIVFERGNITIHGTIAHKGAPGGTLHFRIEGQIEKGSKRRWAQDERFGSWGPSPYSPATYKAVVAYCRSACEPQRGPSAVQKQAQAILSDVQRGVASSTLTLALVASRQRGPRSNSSSPTAWPEKSRR